MTAFARKIAATWDNGFAAVELALRLAGICRDGAVVEGQPPHPVDAMTGRGAFLFGGSPRRSVVTRIQRRVAHSVAFCSAESYSDVGTGRRFVGPMHWPFVTVTLEPEGDGHASVT